MADSALRSARKLDKIALNVLPTPAARKRSSPIGILGLAAPLNLSMHVRGKSWNEHGNACRIARQLSAPDA